MRGRRRFKIIVAAGARPNFIKIAPILREFKKYSKIAEILLVHTGQHYDFKMSEVFFKDLAIPNPDVYLEVGSGSHAEQTAKGLEAFEKIVAAHRPDLVVVVGDVNSTVACALSAVKMGIRVAHVEAGLRSFDRSMPEEINRIITDRISDYLFVSEASGLKNLKREGISPRNVFFSGNVMIDSLLANREAIKQSTILRRLNMEHQVYGVLTLHRPSNVDTKASLKAILKILREICRQSLVIYSIHPRTNKMIGIYGLLGHFNAIQTLKMIEPVGYIDFIKLISGAAFVLTDSGGIQEETTVLRVPCLTMRENTERPATLIQGSNQLVGLDAGKITKGVKKALHGKWKKMSIPARWDGRSAARICRTLIAKLSSQS